MKHSYIKVWGDTVKPKTLVSSLFIIAFSTFFFHLLAPSGENNDTLGLFFGLFGAVFGFLITVFAFKPNRHITEEEDA